MPRLRSLSFCFVVAAAAPAFAQTPPAPPAEAAPAEPTPATPTDAKPADAKPADPTVPPLPTTDPTTTAPVETAPSLTLSSEEVARLKAQIKAELEAELKAQLSSEMEAAARDAATQKAATQEWEEERWVEEVRPNLNFLEIDGYFRTRFDVFSRLDLGTFDPLAAGGVGRGTSSVPPPTYYRPFDGTDDCIDGIPGNFNGDACDATADDTGTLFSANMRLRLDPTLNVSEDIRVRATIDIFDNVVLGSTPESLPGFANNPTLPLPLFAASQNPVQAGLNSLTDAIRVRRVWGEVMTPFGQLRFGRMPQHFGLGLLANDGNKIDNDYGDNADQVMFATRVAGHYIVPAYSFSSVGAVGRGGGAGVGGDGGLNFFAGEQGQRFNLDPADDVHSFLLTIAKKDKEEDIEEQLRAGGIVLNYGVFGVFRTQAFDVPNFYNNPTAATQNPVVSAEDYIVRNANAGIGSLWARFQWDKLKIEAEASGIFGLVEGTGVSSNGTNTVDEDLRQVVDGELTDMPLMILQGGFALESSYSFLNDQLVAGLDFGIASGDDAPGMGLRPVINQNPQAGDLDGKQYGQCTAYDNTGVDRDGDGFADCAKVDSDITNFRFDPDYQVDLILFREILGTVTDAMYVKPHVAYYFNDNLGLRGDLIYSHAMFASSTPGQQNPLGVELDGTGFYGTEDGFYMMVQYGFFLPFGGFSHFNPDVQERFKNAQFAQTFQVWGGVQF